MAAERQLAVIGAGNMGMAIVRGGIDAGVLAAEQVLVIDVERPRRSEAAGLGCAVSEQPADARQADQVLLAVKPQVFSAVAEQIGVITKPTVVISIMAGLSSGAIRAKLGDEVRIVRVMPNTPCQVRRGMSAIALGEGATDDDAQLAERLFSAIGQVVRIEERLMYAVTAVSGSGPAYVFLLAESMQQAAEQMGLDHRTARTLAEQTIIGAGALLESSAETAGALRTAVTSPGGTTAAALEVMFERELPEIIVEALRAARDRGMELDEETI